MIGRGLFLLMAVVVGCASTDGDPIAREIESLIEEIAAEGASGVVRIALGDEVKVRSGFGSADCAGREPMTADHLVMIGSITKELTQLLAYVLAEEETLSFEDPIGKHLPGLPADKASITVGQIVFHTSGLPDLVDADGRPVSYSVAYDYLPVDRAELIRRASAAKLLFTPGERERYSNLGYNLLGALLEIASGESYERLLETRIFEPAGMRRTGYVLPGWRELPFAAGCRAGGAHWGSPLADGMWGAEGPSWNLKAAGGLLSTVDDLARFFGGLKNGLFLGPAMQARYLDERLVRSKLFDQRVMGPAGSNGIFNAVAYWTESSDLRVAIVTTRADHQVEAEEYHRPVILSAARYVRAD